MNKKEKLKELTNTKGITLIALVITIIVLIILTGVSINLLLGENGLINKAISAKEQYNEASIREKVEMELASLYMKNNSNSPLTIEEALQALLQKGTFESIDIATNSGTIDEYQIILKYDENGNIVIDEIGEISGVVASYDLDPIGYTKDANVTIKFKAIGEVKSVTKPDGTVVEATNETVKINYLVNANGTYVFKVEDNDGNVKDKEVVVNTIDTLAPKDFTITAESTKSGITITANAEDAEATDTNACSGIDKYEYYGKLSTEEEYIKYDTSLVELEAGTYNIYVIAYDKAGNSKQSEAITIDKIQAPASNYGQGEKVNYTANGISDWKIFYKNEETDEVFIIVSDYLPIQKIPNEAQIETTGTYIVRWESDNIPDYITITDDVRNRFMMSWNESTTNRNIKCVSQLLNTEIWSTFATKENSYAIGTPTLEMWVESWNDWYPNDLVTCNTSDSIGYYINTGTDAGTNFQITLSENEGYKNKLYFPHTSVYDECYGYWLSSPSAYNTYSLMRVRYSGDVYYNSYDGTVSCVRPVVSLPASLLSYDEATSSWNVE